MRGDIVSCVRLTELTDQAEVVSARYATLAGFQRDDAWYLLKLHEEMGELTQGFLRRAGKSRDKGQSSTEIEAGFRAELADVFGHLLILARHCGVDLEAEFVSKWLVHARSAD